MTLQCASQNTRPCHKSKDNWLYNPDVNFSSSELVLQGINCLLKVSL